jgi:hypothetical protein
MTVRLGYEAYAPAALYHKNVFWYSFLLEAERTPGPSAAGKIREVEKISMLFHQAKRNRDAWRSGGTAPSF